MRTFSCFVFLRQDRRFFSSMTFNEIEKCPPASLYKQLAAMIYDSLLIFAVLFVASAIAMLANAIIFDRSGAIENSPLFSLYRCSVFTHGSGTSPVRRWACARGRFASFPIPAVTPAGEAVTCAFALPCSRWPVSAWVTGGVCSNPTPGTTG